MYSKLRPGTVIVTNTMISEASRFVDGEFIDKYDYKMWKVARFFDLCSLVESCILHEHLATLKGSRLSDDSEELSLRVLLKKEGILLENYVPYDPRKVERKLIAAIGFKRVFNPIMDDPVERTERFWDLLPEAFFVNEREKLDDDLWIKRMLFREFGEEPLERCPDFFSFLRSDRFAEFLQGTGGYDRGAYVLRTFLYYDAATEYCLSFFPDYPRIPFFDSIVTHINDSVIITAYKLFADKLECEAEDFLVDARPLGLPIPPFTSILLKRCNSATDICSELMSLREEYKELRDNLIHLQENRANCRDIKERNAARTRIEEIFKAASEKFLRSGYSKFKSIVEFGEDIPKVIYNPRRPLAYRSALLLKPIEWLRNWWLQRPLAHFFDLAKEFRAIPEYNRLVKKVFDMEFSKSEIDQFKFYQTFLARMFRSRDDTSKKYHSE